MYADDLILMSPSVTELQTMITHYCYQFKLLDLKINSSNSVAITIGNRCNNKCIDLPAVNYTIPWSDESKYLDIYILNLVQNINVALKHVNLNIIDLQMQF